MCQTPLASRALAFAARLVSGCLFDVAAELSPDRMNVDVLTKKEPSRERTHKRCDCPDRVHINGENLAN